MAVNALMPLMIGLMKGKKNAQLAERQQAEKDAATKLQTELLKLKMAGEKTKQQELAFRQKYMDLWQSQNMQQAQSTQPQQPQGDNAKMGESFNGPSLLDIMAMSGDPALSDFANYQQRKSHNAAIERQGDERNRISMNRLEDQNRAVSYITQTIPNVGEVKIPVNRFGQVVGTVAPFISKPSSGDMPISPDDLPLWVNPETNETPKFGTTPKQAEGAGYKRIGATQKGNVISLAAVNNVMSSIERLMSDVFPKTEGALGRASGGAKRSAGAALQTDVKASQLKSLTEGTLAPIIRSLGEKGALAEGDVARAMSLMPKLTDRADVAWAKIEQLKELMSKVKDSTIGMPPAAPDMIYNPQTGRLEPAK